LSVRRSIDCIFPKEDGGHQRVSTHGFVVFPDGKYTTWSLNMFEPIPSKEGMSDFIGQYR
jgi:hypothetical protein